MAYTELQRHQQINKLAVAITSALGRDCNSKFLSFTELEKIGGPPAYISGHVAVRWLPLVSSKVAKNVKLVRLRRTVGRPPGLWIEPGPVT